MFYVHTFVHTWHHGMRTKPQYAQKLSEFAYRSMAASSRYVLPRRLCDV